MLNKAKCKVDIKFQRQKNNQNKCFLVFFQAMDEKNIIHYNYEKDDWSYNKHNEATVDYVVHFVT